MAGHDSLSEEVLRRDRRGPPRMERCTRALCWRSLPRGGHCLESHHEVAAAEACCAGRREYEESKFMKLPQLSFVAAIASATFTIGCATTGTTATAPPVSMRGTADAVIHISGLS